MIHSPDHPLTFSYIAGVGGTDVTPEVIQKIALDAMKSEGSDGCADLGHGVMKHQIPEYQMTSTKLQWSKFERRTVLVI